MTDNNTDLVGRIAGMAMTKLTGMNFSTGVYFKIIEVVGNEAKAICTNPGLPRMERSFAVDQLRRQLLVQTIQGQLAAFEGEALDYVAKCYLTERQADETDEHLKARLTATGLGPRGLN
jgi:hypothetical protein